MKSREDILEGVAAALQRPPERMIVTDGGKAVTISFADPAAAAALLQALNAVRHLRPPETWRHRERGTVYRIVGEARIQCPPGAPLQDNETALLYRDTSSGKYAVRRPAEFHDGRFAPVSTETGDGGPAQL